MGRQKTIFVNRKKLLAAIASQIIADVGAVDERAAALGFWTDELRLERNHAGWPEQNLSRWAARELTPSERLRHQQVIQQLEQDGLIRRQTRYLTLTPRGWERSGIEPPPPDPPTLAQARRRAAE